jgi:hypothetical protein
MLMSISQSLVLAVVKAGRQVGRSWNLGQWRRQVLAQLIESLDIAQSRSCECVKSSGDHELELA